MITYKDVRVENGNLVLNGDKYPLDGQSPEAIMQIVEDNSDTTPTENSDAPITSGGVYDSIASILSELSFKLFDPDVYPSWDNFPEFAFGYGYQAQTNNPGANGFCFCFGSSAVKIQIFFAVTQSMQKYRIYSSGTWTNWKEF